MPGAAHRKKVSAWGSVLTAVRVGYRSLWVVDRQSSRWVRRTESFLAVALFTAILAIPLTEMVSREVFNHSLPGGSSAVQYLTLMIAFIGASLAARSDKLLALATTRYLPARTQRAVRVTTGFATVAVTACLFVASVKLINVDRTYGTLAVWQIPIWIIALAMPIGLSGLIWWVIRLSGPTVIERLLIASGLFVPIALAYVSEPVPLTLVWILTGGIVFATALGMPLFAAIGSGALLFGWIDGTPISAVAGENYRLATSPLLPAIPLFTLAGFILSAGKSGRRLLRLFQASVGWIPGGLALVTTGLLALFTPLTGASGITILALGGLLLPMLRNGQYPEQTSIGLVTSSGSIGVLLPPSLPVILYAFYAQLPIEQLFLGGLLPGLLLIVAVSAWAGFRGSSSGAKRETFRIREFIAALWGAKWEVAMPVILLSALFLGWTTLVETAALTVAYVLFVECLLFREIDLRHKLPWIMERSAKLVGGFMIILGMALALTNYLILAEVPNVVLGWVQAHIHSPQMFLLSLNGFLLIVGALMDIFSAIIVVVPLLMPMITAYHLDPLHVGIIFLVNMELGYLTPPVGANLFLSAYRFNRTLPEICLATLPYMVILLAVVLAVTYLPTLTLWPVKLLDH
jgi:C4-dicarboxylate transporter DctM subunit